MTWLPSITTGPAPVRPASPARTRRRAVLNSALWPGSTVVLVAMLWAIGRYGAEFIATAFTVPMPNVRACAYAVAGLLAVNIISDLRVMAAQWRRRRLRAALTLAYLVTCYTIVVASATLLAAGTDRVAHAVGLTSGRVDVVAVAYIAWFAFAPIIMLGGDLAKANTSVHSPTATNTMLAAMNTQLAEKKTGIPAAQPQTVDPAEPGGTDGTA